MNKGSKSIIVVLLIFVLTTPFLWHQKFQVKAKDVKANLTGNIFDQGVDVNGNGAFDYLEVGVQVNVTEAGTYVVQVMGLESNDFPFSIGIIDSQYVSFDTGIQIVNLHLDGITIYVSGLNPMNISHIILYDGNYNLLGELFEFPLSRKYLSTEFETPGAALTGVLFDQGIDVDSNGLFDFLEVGVELNVTKAGDYVVEVNGLLGLISGNYTYIGVRNSQQGHLEAGIQVIYIRLDGPTIFASDANPINVSNVILRMNEAILGTLTDVPLSRGYLHTQFEGPAAMLTGVITDHGIDTDEDGIFEYLEIGVEVNVTKAGTYIVEVNGLMTGDNNYISVSASQSVSLNVGLQVVYFRLNGVTIFASGLDPAIVSNIVLYDEFRNYISSLPNVPLSKIYFHTEFGTPIKVTVGVKVGDWAKYNMTISWQSTAPGATEPPQFQEMRKIEYVKIEVISIGTKQGDNTTITLQMSYHFLNGTDFALPTSSGDIATQFITLIIPGSLNAGDAIPGTAAPINGTVIRRYAGVDRTVNYLGFSGSFMTYNMSQIMYWDKVSGLLCEMLMETSVLTEGYVTTTSTSLKMIETNVVGKMPSALSCNVSKDTVTQGESIVVSGSINATLSGKTVTLTYKKPDGSTFNRTVSTGSDGSYSDSYTPDAAGTWSVTASWTGDTSYNGANSSTRSLTVNAVTFILFTPFGIALLGGIILIIIIAVLIFRRRPKIPENKKLEEKK